MIGLLAATDALTRIGNLFGAQPPSATQPQSKTSSPVGPVGASPGGQTVATISGPGQLLANLEELQSQDPVRFRQVTTQIAAQLRTAAQQASPGANANLLSDLSIKFQNIANGGSLSQLQPQTPQSTIGIGAYTSAAQNSTAGLIGLTLQNGNQSNAPNSNLQQIFVSISNQVSRALQS
jgi:hypothetical protein